MFVVMSYARGRRVRDQAYIRLITEDEERIANEIYKIRSIGDPLRIARISVFQIEPDTSYTPQDFENFHHVSPLVFNTWRDSKTGVWREEFFGGFKLPASPQNPPQNP